MTPRRLIRIHLETIAVALVLLCRSALSDCPGHDLRPDLKKEAPRDYAELLDRSAKVAFAEGRFYKLTRLDGPPSFLFGTLHVSDPRVAALSSGIETAMARSKTVVLELANLGAERMALSHLPQSERDKILRAEPKDSAFTLLDTTDFESLKSAVHQQGFPIKLAFYLKPQILALIVDNVECGTSARSGDILDINIARMAMSRNLPIVGLETLTEQLLSLDGLSPEDEKALLIAALKQNKHGADMSETAIRLYLEGGIGRLATWIRSRNPIPGEKAAGAPPAFLDKLLSARSHRMAERALPLLEKGNVFMAVGAAHLPGPDGLLRLLEEAGYTVTKID